MVKRALDEGTDFPTFVIVGRQGWLTRDLEQIISRDETLKDKLLLVHNADDEHLSWFYQNCKFTMYPSFYEGWGLPIAESLYYGKLCLPSSSSSMTEIAGDMLEYFSPYNIGEAYDLVLKYHTDAKLLKAKEKQIAAKYTLTSWHQTCKYIEDIIARGL
jgi:glycosyltransferase involved in cell wall biosynthesis